MTQTLLILWALIFRDLLGLLRRPSRVVAVIGTPLLVWGFMTLGFSNSSPLGDDQAFSGYLLPGMAVLLVVFSSVMGAIALIQDRHDGILPALLVSPPDRALLATARITSASLVSVLQALVIIPLVPMNGGTLTISGLGIAILALVLMSVGVSGLSLAAAWKIDSVAGFHGVMNLVLMPMWLLSGSIAPVSASVGVMGWAAWWNPLGAGSGIMRGAMGLPEPRDDALAWALLVGFAVIGFLAAWSVFGRAPTAMRRNRGRR